MTGPQQPDTTPARVAAAAVLRAHTHWSVPLGERCRCGWTGTRPGWDEHAAAAVVAALDAQPGDTEQAGCGAVGGCDSDE